MVRIQNGVTVFSDVEHTYLDAFVNFIMEYWPENEIMHWLEIFPFCYAI